MNAYIHACMHRVALVVMMVMMVMMVMVLSLQYASNPAAGKASPWGVGDTHQKREHHPVNYLPNGHNSPRYLSINFLMKMKADCMRGLPESNTSCIKSID
jgi:hypothetical protein